MAEEEKVHINDKLKKIEDNIVMDNTIEAHTPLNSL